MKLASIKAKAIRANSDSGRECIHGTVMQVRGAKHFVTFLLETGSELTVGVTPALYDIIIENLDQQFTLTVSG